MITVQLEDASIEELRREAQRLGVDVTAAMRDGAPGEKKDAIVSKIRSARASQPKSRWNNPALLPIASLLVAVLALAANWWMTVMAKDAVLAEKESVEVANEALRHEIEKVQQDNERDRKEDWQTIVVFNIIEKAFTEQTDQYVGISFGDIRDKYVAEAATVKEVELKKEDIQPLVLRKILLLLMQSGLVYMTNDKNYVVNLAELNPRFGTGAKMARAKTGVIVLLNNRAAGVPDIELQTEICEEFSLSPSDFLLLLANLLSEGLIERDADGEWVGALTKRTMD